MDHMAVVTADDSNQTHARTTKLLLAAAVLVGLLLVGTIPILAAETPSAPETKPLDEVQALRIKVLILERQVIQEQAGRLQLEKAIAVNTAVEAAAKAAELDLKDGWQPDVDARVWRKGK